MDKLQTTLEKGLTPHDFDTRNQFFSSNYKAPPKMTPYWRLFLNALDDFMLKFLSVCAVIELVIEAFSLMKVTDQLVSLEIKKEQK